MQLIGSVFGTTALVLAVVSIDAHAASLRCKGDLAQIGDSKGSVLMKCGEPVYTDSFCEPIAQHRTSRNSGGKGSTVNVDQCESVDEWTYNPGYGQFFTTLRFERGALKTIKYGERVP